MALQRTVHLVGEDVHQFAVHEFIVVRDMQHLDGGQLHVAIEVADLGAVVGLQLRFLFFPQMTRMVGREGITVRALKGVRYLHSVP